MEDFGFIAKPIFIATQMPMLEAEMKMSPKSTLHDGTVNIQIVDHASPCMFTKLLLDLETEII